MFRVTLVIGRIGHWCLGSRTVVDSEAQCGKAGLCARNLKARKSIFEKRRAEQSCKLEGLGVIEIDVIKLCVGF